MTLRVRQNFKVKELSFVPPPTPITTGGASLDESLTLIIETGAADPEAADGLKLCTQRIWRAVEATAPATPENLALFFNDVDTWKKVAEEAWEDLWPKPTQQRESREVQALEDMAKFRAAAEKQRADISRKEVEAEKRLKQAELTKFAFISAIINYRSSVTAHTIHAMQ